jgi:hypothetical protein
LTQAAGGGGRSLRLSQAQFSFVVV